MKRQSKEDKHKDRHPFQIKVPGFVSDREIGLGDVVKKVTYALGIKPCGGCARRAATLNSWMVFTGRR
jgi:hypothetical protein